MIKKILTLAFVAQALTVANVWAEDKVTTYDFEAEDASALFTADSRITVAIENNATLSSNVVGFTSAANTANGYAFAHYDFSSLLHENPTYVKVEFDFYNTNGARSILSIGDATTRGTTGGSSKGTYNATGVLFQIGSNKSNSFVNGVNKTLADLTDKWMHIALSVDVLNKKQSYEITIGGASYLKETDVAYYQDAASCTQIDVWDGVIKSAHMMMIDNLKITSVVDESVSTANYTVEYVCGDTKVTADNTRNGIVDTAIDLTEADKEARIVDGKKYIYTSDNSAEKTIASDGSTVVTVSFREAEVYTYSIKTSVGTVLAEGSNFEGESITTYAIARDVDAEGNLYKYGSTTYTKSYTLTANLDLYKCRRRQRCVQ